MPLNTSTPRSLKPRMRPLRVVAVGLSVLVAAWVHMGSVSAAPHAVAVRRNSRRALSLSMGAFRRSDSVMGIEPISKLGCVFARHPREGGDPVTLARQIKVTGFPPARE